MKKAFFFISLLGAAIISLGCLWDYDTLEMEKQQFPGIEELIAGKFLRHSTEFYEWRIQDRQGKLAKDPNNLAYLDDLAVAYSKTHRDKEAIALMFKKEKIAPGLYETYANLGTFYIHDGQYEKGLEYIDKAIAINPDAHFGREVYQRYLVEYVLEKRKSGVEGLPLNQYNKFGDNCINFYYFLYMKHSKNAEPGKNPFPKEELEKAIKGISGMIKFGNSDSPILMEVLGDLLSSSNSRDAARQLAAFAYYRASTAVASNDSSSLEYYRIIIRSALGQQVYNGQQGFFNEEKEVFFSNKSNFLKLKVIFDKSIEDGHAYFQQIRQDEMAWIAAGEDPEQKFKEKYYDQISKTDSAFQIMPRPNRSVSPSTTPARKQPTPKQSFPILPILLIAALVFGGLIFFIIKFSSKK